LKLERRAAPSIYLPVPILPLNEGSFGTATFRPALIPTGDDAKEDTIAAGMCNAEKEIENADAAQPWAINLGCVKKDA
jgi:hypothetical protein